MPCERIASGVVGEVNHIYSGSIYPVGLGSILAFASNNKLGGAVGCPPAGAVVRLVASEFSCVVTSPSRSAAIYRKVKSIVGERDNLGIGSTILAFHSLIDSPLDTYGVAIVDAFVTDIYGSGIV